MAESLWIAAAWKSTAVLGVGWLGALVLRHRSAAERHLVWTLAMAAVVILPWLSVSLPAFPVSVAPGLLPESIGSIFHATVHGSPGSSPRAASLAAAYRSFDWLILLWAAGTAVGFAQMLAAYAAVRRAARRAPPFSDHGLCAALCGSLGIRRPVQVLETRPASMPMTFGFLRCTILLPYDAEQWSEERRRMVLLHELAHVRRRDAAMHLVARLALSFYWWNPLAWVAWREFLKERERAADDLVLKAGARASDYAGHLLAVARGLRPAAMASWGAVAMGRRSQLEDRLNAVLDASLSRRAPGRLGTAMGALLAAAMLVPLAAVKARDAMPPTASNERKMTANLISLGAGAILSQDFPRAISYFERARQADPNEAGPALMWMAVVRERQRNATEADKLYQRALALQDLKSGEALTTLKLYSRFLREHGRADGAKDFEARAATIQQTNTMQIALRTSGVYRMGPGISPPKLVSKVEPSYSEEARAAKLAGTVRLYVEVEPDGLAHNARVLQPLGLGLDDRALQAIRQWRFEPGVKDGRAVRVAATVEINFRLI